MQLAQIVVVEFGYGIPALKFDAQSADSLWSRLITMSSTKPPGVIFTGPAINEAEGAADADGSGVLATTAGTVAGGAFCCICDALEFCCCCSRSSWLHLLQALLRLLQLPLGLLNLLAQSIHVHTARLLA